MKKLIISLVGLSCIQSTMASGIPVVDVASITQAVLTLQQLKTQYEQITNQYNQAVRTYSNFTGNRGLGLIHYDASLRSLLPADARQNLSQVMRLGKSALSGEALAIFNEGGYADVCDGLGKSSKNSCLNEQASKAQYQAYLQKSAQVANQRLQNIERLMGQINSATDAKAIADLSARISVEQAALEATKLHASLQLQELERYQNQLMHLEQQKQHRKTFTKVSDADIARLLRY